VLVDDASAGLMPAKFKPQRGMLPKDWDLAQATIACCGMAPDCLATSRPFENRIIVGIDRIP
jgi:hypothetical protein